MKRFLAIFIILTIFIGTGYYYTNFYNKPALNLEEKITSNPEIITREVNGVFYFVDKTNKISFYIDTNKEILNENLNPNNKSKQEASVKVTFNTGPTIKMVYQIDYSPKQWFGQEGGHFFSIALYNDKFDPNIFWKDYIKEDFFKYEEKNIGKFKVFQTETEPGISRNYSTYFIVNPNKYLHVFYYPNFEEKFGQEQYEQLLQTVSDNTNLEDLVKQSIN